MKTTTAVTNFYAAMPDQDIISQLEVEAQTTYAQNFEQIEGVLDLQMTHLRRSIANAREDRVMQGFAADQTTEMSKLAGHVAVINTLHRNAGMGNGDPASMRSEIEAYNETVIRIHDNMRDMSDACAVSEQGTWPGIPTIPAEYDVSDTEKQALPHQQELLQKVREMTAVAYSQKRELIDRTPDFVDIDLILETRSDAVVDDDGVAPAAIEADFSDIEAAIANRKQLACDLYRITTQNDLSAAKAMTSLERIKQSVNAFASKMKLTSRVFDTPIKQIDGTAPLKNDGTIDYNQVSRKTIQYLKLFENISVEMPPKLRASVKQVIEQVKENAFTVHDNDRNNKTIAEENAQIKATVSLIRGLETLSRKVGIEGPFRMEDFKVANDRRREILNTGDRELAAAKAYAKEQATEKKVRSPSFDM